MCNINTYMCKTYSVAMAPERLVTPVGVRSSCAHTLRLKTHRHMA